MESDQGNAEPSLSCARCGKQALLQSSNFSGISKILRELCVSGYLTKAVNLLCWKVNSVGWRAYSLLLQESINRRDALSGKRIHWCMVTAGCVINSYLITKLLIFYAKIGEMSVAKHIFGKSPVRNVVSWNAMISGFVQNGLEQDGLELYQSMRLSGLKPDQFTFASVMRACARLALLDHGRKAHCLLIKLDIKDNIVVNSAVMDMYLKCGSLYEAHQTFRKSFGRNVIMWTALVSGYGQHGLATEALELFEEMLEDGFQPNTVTFLAVFSACGRAGFIDQGLKCFSMMLNVCKIRPRSEHYAAVVDMLARSGRLNDAHELVKNLRACEDHSVIWGTLLGACKKHGNTELVEFAANKFFELQPNNAGKYVVLAHTYAFNDMWDNAAAAYESLRLQGIQKDPATSFIELHGVTYTFFAGDVYNDQSERIFEVCISFAHDLNAADYERFDWMAC